MLDACGSIAAWFHRCCHLPSRAAGQANHGASFDCANFSSAAHLPLAPMQVLDSLGYFRSWPAAVTGMTALHSLLGWDLLADAQLPPGAHLHGLRRLALPAHAAGLSLAALAAAEQLQELELSWPRRGEPATVEPAVEAVRWAARCPSLRRLCTCLDNKPVPAAILDAFMQAQRSNPSLHVHSHSNLHAALLRGARALS